MTSTIDRAEINRRNARKSTGPRTSEGKARSRLNAVKHGMTATIPVLPGEDGEAFLQRVEEWTADLAPRNAVERFLVERAVTDSWKIERADRVEAARLTAILRPTSAGPTRAEMDEAEALGRRLICEYDEAPAASGPAPGPGGPIAGKPAASGVSGSGVGPRDPRVLLDRLESTAAGCRWLRDKWAELRGILDRGDTWSNYDLGTAIYLMGLEPVRREDEVWEYLLCKEPDPVGVEEHRLQLGRQLDETITSEGTCDRAFLRPIVDRAIARLDQLLTPPTGQAEAEAAEMLHRLAFDADAEAQLLRRYQFDCGRSLRRTLDTLLKLRRDSRGQGRTARRDEDRSIVPPAVRDEAIAPAVEPRTSHDQAVAPGVAPSPLQDEAVTPDVEPSSRPDGAIAPAVAATPVENEVTAPAVEPPVHHEQTPAPTVDATDLQNEAIAPNGHATRSVPAVPANAPAWLALFLFAGLADAAWGMVDVNGPAPSRPVQRDAERKPTDRSRVHCGSSGDSAHPSAWSASTRRDDPATMGRDRPTPHTLKGMAMERRMLATASRGFCRRGVLLVFGAAIVGVVASRTPISRAQGQQLQVDEARAAAALEKLGGKVYRDGTRPGEPVIGVDLDETEVNDAGLAHLEALPHLQHLSIDETPITDAGLAHLEHLGELTDLSLDHTAIGDAGAAHLRRLVGLRKLTMVHSGITDAGLAQLKGLNRLETLSLIGTKVTDAGLEHLQGLQRLEWLLLDGDAITDAGLVHLKGLGNLEYLLLNKTAVTDDGLRQLAGLKQLEMLSLHGTGVTEAGVEALQKSLPRAKIYH